MDTFSTLDKLSVLLAAISLALGAWVLADWAQRVGQRWQRRYVEETELEFQETLIQLPAAKFINYSISIGGVLGVLAFGVVGALGDTWNWKGGLACGLLMFTLVVVGARQLLNLLRANRLNKFNDQLEEALMSMSNSLKAGFSITQAIDLVIRQKRVPISIEFKLMLQQTQLGMTFDDALKNMADRVQSDDFRLVASAISTARMTGGDLTGIFDRLASLIRERLRLQRRIRSLTAQGRLQGMVLGLLPMLLLGIMFFLDPTLIKDFFTQPIGILLLLGVVFLEVCGYLVIRKIVNIDI